MGGTGEPGQGWPDPLSPEQHRAKPPLWKRQWFLVLAGIFLLSGVVRLVSGEPEPAPPQPQTPAPRPPVASCDDATGDGQPLDLTRVTLTQDGDQLVVRFETVAAPPQTGTVLYSISGASQAGDRALQLGVKFLDGEQIAFYVFDFGQGGQENLDETATLDGASLTARFPASAVEDLGQPWNWQAATNVEGVDVDECPELRNDLPFPS